MTQLNKSALKLFIIFIMFGLLGNSYAQLPKNSTHKLQQINQQIQSVKTHLANDEKTKSDLQQEFKTIEIKIGQLSHNLHQLNKELNNEHKKLNELNTQENTYQNQIKLQQQIISQQLVSAYILGRENYLKVLLSQQDPNKLARMMTYYHYLSQQRVNALSQINQSLQALSQTKLAIQQQTDILQKLEEKQQLQAKQLEASKQTRAQLLQTINHSIQNKNQTLSTLLANKQALEQVLTKIRTTETKSYYNLPTSAELAKMQGRFPWPTQGKVIEGFGTSIQQSELKLNGVIISAPEGQTVNSIAPGHVVFANWLAGYGLLIIIDHGHGLMTLYGRNSSLYKKVGDTVRAGEAIAAVGHSGGYTSPSLYFAIRKNGIAVDPRKWCSHPSQFHKRRA